MKPIQLFFLSAFLYPLAIFSQSPQENPADALMRIKEQVTFLSDDKLQGRLTGSKGEKQAASYIIKQYKAAGLKPAGAGGSWLQPFPYNAGKKAEGKNELIINGQSLAITEDYFPVNLSANAKAKGSIVDVGFGMAAPKIRYDSYSGLRDLKGKIFLIECSTPDGDNPHSQYAPFADIKLRVDQAIEKGAVAIIFTNSNEKADDLKPNLDIHTTDATIPVIFIKAAAWKKVKRDQLNVAEMVVSLKTVSVTGHNVAGYLDNNSTSTIVIGGHYDHLGYNEFGGSLHRGEKGIHNGADDNASGTTGVMELARRLANNGITEKNNFLFLCFSGEEQGLIGSKYWVEHATYDTAKINFMINLDMIGRYRSDKGVQVSGLGTSPEKFEFIRRLTFDTLKIIPGEQGTGPSDHTSFYLANIPVLFFFTGTHEDYHKPSDDAPLVNYQGEYEIIRLIEKIVMTLDGEGTLPFAKTKQTDNADVPQFKVRLGIIPDYAFEGPGLRVDGVNDGQPAADAGIKKGDIILSIGSFPISDIMAYMKALASFQKGDQAPVKVKREAQEVELKVTF
jgi:hypothetical protein